MSSMRQPKLWWLFSNFRWYRRWCGGKWERWYVNPPVSEFVWYQVADWSIPGYERPTPLAAGNPEDQEEYPTD